MLNNKFTIINLFLFAVFIITALNGYADQKYIQEKVSFINIYGSSNINAFQMEYRCVDKKMTFDKKGEQLLFNVPCKSIQCNNPLIIHDFRRLIKSKQYPIITTKISGIAPFENNSKCQKQTINLELTITSVTQQYDILCTFDSVDSVYTQISGIFPLRLSDFMLSPPKKMFGLVSLDDRIDIEFNFLCNLNRMF